ncbi:peptidase [uncultured Methanobrevibacter sp.]|uniref:peptidase n=1 Tax=uncultured Methanobrevibacter sp. TaxID=253161 RepID=UPI0025D987E3|nr:peptidase [uncultured Methanobrevibacter sp.]MEE1134046.1 peptidase [Methanobrevibacter sp.]MEE3489509.1 peptidase [Methanobrevibacter sp.]
MDKTKKFLKKIGIDEVSNEYVSSKRFGDGGQFRFEVPGIQSPKTMKALLDEALKSNIFIHRVTQTKGIMMLADEEIEEMVSLAKDYGCELFLSVGPRATYDTSATVHTKEGSRIGYRLRGYDNLVYAIEDVKRACRLGVRGILLYDEGLLWVLNQMRRDGEIPESVHFKLSAHAGHSNAASAKLLEENGLNSLNPVRDLQIPMIASIRNATDMALDLHTENPKSTGGFIRHYEVPNFIKVASPVYLKTGGSVAANHNWDTTEKEAIARIKQVRLVKRMIDEYCPDAVASPDKSADLAVPE